MQSQRGDKLVLCHQSTDHYDIRRKDKFFSICIFVEGRRMKRTFKRKKKNQNQWFSKL